MDGQALSVGGGYRELRKEIPQGGRAGGIFQKQKQYAQQVSRENAVQVPKEAFHSVTAQRLLVLYVY